MLTLENLVSNASRATGLSDHVDFRGLKVTRNCASTQIITGQLKSTTVNAFEVCTCQPLRPQVVTDYHTTTDCYQDGNLVCNGGDRRSRYSHSSLASRRSSADSVLRQRTAAFSGCHQGGKNHNRNQHSPRHVGQVSLLDWEGRLVPRAEKARRFK